MLVSYLQLYWTCFRAKPIALVRKKDQISPVTFLAISLLFSGTILEAAWGENPLGFLVESYDAGLLGFLANTIPFPVISLVLVFVTMTAVYSLIAMKLCGFSVRHQRLWRFGLLVNGSFILCMISLAVLYFGILSIYVSQVSLGALYVFQLFWFSVMLWWLYVFCKFLGASFKTNGLVVLAILSSFNIPIFAVLALFVGIEKSKEIVLWTSGLTPPIMLFWDPAGNSNVNPNGAVWIIDTRQSAIVPTPGQTVVVDWDFGLHWSRVIAMSGQTLEYNSDGFLIDGKPVKNTIVEPGQHLSVDPDTDGLVLRRINETSPENILAYERKESLPNGAVYSIWQWENGYWSNWNVGRIGQNELFVMSDERDLNIDSRFGEYGLVPESAIKGIPRFQLFPFNRTQSN